MKDQVQDHEFQIIISQKGIEVLHKPLLNNRKSYIRNAAPLFDLSVSNIEIGVCWFLVKSNT